MSREMVLVGNIILFIQTFCNYWYFCCVCVFLYCSVLVKLGPRDYWSKRMAEFTGKRHRVLFDETLEKIYNRLYTKASLAK